MKATFSVALMALGFVGVAHADVLSGSLSDIAQNVSGTASISSVLGNDSASFGPETGSSTAQALAHVSGEGVASIDPRTNTPLPYSYDFQALSSAHGDFQVASSITTFSPVNPSFASNASLNATVTWTGTLVNTTSETRSFSLLSQFRALAGPDTNVYGTATLSFNGRTMTASGNDFDVHYDLGTLAPGQRSLLSYTVVSSNSLNSLASGNGLLLAPLLGYEATSVSPVPEPGTTAMMVAGLGGLVWLRRRKTLAQKAGARG